MVIVCTGAAGGDRAGLAQRGQGRVDRVLRRARAGARASPCPLNDFWTKEIRVLTSYYCGPPDIREAIGLLASGKIEVDSLVTHRLPLERIAEGFALMLEGKEAVKVIIEPNGPSRGR